MRLPNASSASVPTIACSGTPAWRVRVPISPTSLPCSVCSSSLPSPVTTARGGAHALVEVERVEDERRARLERRRRARPTARRTSPPAAPVIGTPRGSRGKRVGQLVEALAEPLHHAPASAPFCGPNTSAQRSHGSCTSHSTTIRAPPQAAGLLDRLQRPRAAVGGGRAADRDEDHLRAALDRGGDQLAGAVGAGRPRVALVFGDEREPGGRRHLHQRGAAALDQPVAARRSRGPAGPARRADAVSPPRLTSRASSVPSPPSATGHRSGGTRPARSSPRPIAPATWAARNVP